jgi:glycosyltransferase involved in cell wall biosynthesis
MKIDIVVHGRFHAFDLARALIDQGHDVLVHTNYPKSIVKRFGLSEKNVRSFVSHGILSRLAYWKYVRFNREILDRVLHTMFGRWAARSVRRDADVVHGFSGVMEEVLERHQGLTSVVRGSAHIRVQDEILRSEEARAGQDIERPTRWIIAREEREYRAADQVTVLSRFAHTSFVSMGYSGERLMTLSLGVDIRRFRLSPEQVSQRVERIRSGQPLRIVTVGTFSYQKGILDLIDVAERMKGRMTFRFVGHVPGEAHAILERASSVLEFVARVPEFELPDQYAWGDVFLYPTVQDGFAIVLLQAAAAGLPILATTNCAAPDFVREGLNGWIIGIRDPGSIADRLAWCDENRRDLAEMIGTSCTMAAAKDWERVAAEFVERHEQAIEQKKSSWRKAPAAIDGSAS